MKLKKILQEPLVHFLLIGVALFVFYGLTRDVGSEAPNRIVVSGGQVEQLSANFARTWMRPPTQEELDALIESHVREEVFYREALAMGLDQNDPMVRRRMRMKLEFMLEDLASQDVSDEILTVYLKDNPEKFHTEVQVSFQQVFLNMNKRQDLASEVKKMLADLNNGAPPETVGDSTLLPLSHTLATESEITGTFGNDFAQEIKDLSVNNWTGPVYSAYGVHLLRVSERIEAYTPELADIRVLVEREYLVEKSKEQKNLAFQQLRKNYVVTIEPIITAQDKTDGMISTAQADEAQ